MKLSKTAAIILVTPKGELILQRRDAKASASPKKLSLFGGHMHEGEEPIDALLREVGEETTIALGDVGYEFTGIIDTPPYPGHNLHGRCFIFFAKLKDDNFKVYEGKGHEKYLYYDLMQREDIDQATKYVLNELKGRHIWPSA